MKTWTLDLMTAYRRMLVACSALLLAVMGIAQGPANSSITLKIKDLSSEERDALVRQLEKGGEARVAFACVPAGILVLEATTQGRTVDSLRLRAMPGLLASVAPARITEEHIALNEAEQRCSNARASR